MSKKLGPILLIGGNGMLGRAWRELLDKEGIEYEAPSRSELNITVYGDVSNYLDQGFQIVINCAAYTDVDGAEEHENEAERINGIAVANLATQCASRLVLLVHYSTDYVFSGKNHQPYPVNWPTSPISAYGRSKNIGELMLLEGLACPHLLIRTSWLYAPWGKNFVRTIARAAKHSDKLRVVIDQRGRPTSAEHLARTSYALLERRARSIWHVTDGGECTWFDFAVEICKHVNPNCQIEKQHTRDLKRPAIRPAYSVLDLSHIETVFGPMPHWQDNLADVIKRLEPDIA